MSDANLEKARAGVILPAYDRGRITIGVVHFGPGAFHRVHQAFYFDHLLASDPGLGIAAVSLRSLGLRDALGPQDGLYVLAEIAANDQYRVIGAIKKILVAPEAPEAVLAYLAAPETRFVTITVTEKGYCLNARGELDLSQPEIRHDLLHPSRPVSLIGYLSTGLAMRRDRGLEPFTTLSCDNLTENGRRLKRAVVYFAAMQNAELARWIESSAHFPCTMVDSITPATTEALKDRVARAVGLSDAWPVQREAFSQFVIEDEFGPGAPDWGRVGVIVTQDIEGYEQAKLRLLNGAHSTLAYIGLLRGYETVREAMADGELARFIALLMKEDIAPTLLPPPDLEIESYIADILERFRNPSIVHKLTQIAWDGSQKLPVRILGTVRDRLERGLTPGRLAVSIAAWMRFIADHAKREIEIIDPLGSELAELGRKSHGQAKQDMDLFFSFRAVFPEALARHQQLRQAVATAYDSWASAAGSTPMRGLAFGPSSGNLSQ